MNFFSLLKRNIIYNLKRKVSIDSDKINFKSFPEKNNNVNEYKKVLSFFKPDAAIVCVPDHLHYKITSFLLKQKIPQEKTILYGESLGCGLAVKLSTETAFNATILEAPYTSIADIASRHYWYLPAKLLVLDRFDIFSMIKNIKSPLLVIHGEKDNVININFGKKVFKSAPEPKKAIFVKNAGHNNLFEFNIYEKIEQFLEELKK